MKLSNISFALISLILLAFCPSKTEAQKPIPVFDLGKNLGQTTELKLSDLASEISYLPLELTPKSLLAGINIILPAGDLLVVATRDNKIKVFDQKGKYINDIGTIGKGPGEYGAINTVFWDDLAKEVIVYKLDPKSWPTETIALDKIIKEIRVIPLETKSECLIGYIGHMLITPDMVITVDTKTYQALCFDLKGKFLRTLGTIGKGPGEYQSASSVLLNKDRQEILLYDFQKRKINFYKPTGEYLRQSSLKTGGMEIKLVNKDLIAIHAGRMGMNQEKCQLAVLKLTGEIQNTFFPFSEQIWADCCCGFANGTKPNSVLYHKAFDYRIYEVFEDRVTTLLALDFGSARLDSAKYMNTNEFFNAANDKGKILGYNLLNNTPEHLVANISSENGIRGIWILDHRSKNHQFLAVDKNHLAGTFKGIPVKIPQQTDGSWLISYLVGLNWNEAIGKLTEAQKVILRKEVPGFTEAEKVAMDGNPVVVVYRFKDF